MLPKIDNTFLMQFEDFKLSVDGGLMVESSIIETPEARIEQAYKELNVELASELLDCVKRVTPQFFEQLVMELMQSMGYGGWGNKSGFITQYSADGGIDGIINSDPLGLETIYLQAKRYTDKTVGRPDVQAFAGALDMQQANKGVFITSSQFSAEAIYYADRIEKKIILIDGKTLASLMVEYGLGVHSKKAYETKAIDTAYFGVSE